MSYNIFISYAMGDYNILCIPEKHLDVIKNAWLKGDQSFYLSGQQYQFKNCNSLQIFINEKNKTRDQLLTISEQYGEGRGFVHTYFTLSQLEKFGENITDDIIGDNGYGSLKKFEMATDKTGVNKLYIHPDRITELENINEKIDFDLKKLIAICKEINDNYERENYYSVTLLLRTILNHIPPAFNNKENFDQVLAELNGKKNQTRRDVFSKLHEVQRKLTDLVTHEKLRNFEPVMVAQDVQFIPEVNFLLKEVYQEFSKSQSLNI